MPNIELHGFLHLEKESLIADIDSVVPEGLKKEVVVAFVPSEVFDLDGNVQPFLRVYDTEERPELDKALRSLGYDIEYPPLLARFVPAEELVDKL